MQSPARTPSPAVVATLCVAVSLAGLSASAGPRLVMTAPPARPTRIVDSTPPMAMPEIARSVKSLLAASYLSEDERKDLRVRHGIWEASDLDTPTRRAQAAALCGRFNDPSFDDATVPAEVRAEGLLGRGEPEAALATIKEAASLRSFRQRAQAMWDLGRLDEARTSLESTRRALMDTPLSDSSEIAEAVRAMVLLSRLSGDSAGGADQRSADFKLLMSVLARAREELDRLDPLVYLAEAELLQEKENYSEASEALRQAMELNPRSAAGWALLGRMSADTWDFDLALSIASRLDELALWESDPEDAGDARSVLGAEVAARAFLRMQEPEAAEAAIDRAAERAPRSRVLKALRPAVAAASFDDELLRERLGEFDALAPGSPDALFEVGSVLSDLRQYADAEKYLVLAAERAPRWAAVQCELGLLQVQAGRDEEARRTLGKAAALDPFNTRVANSLTLVTEISTYDRVTSDHFEIRFKPGIDGVLAAEMLPVMEENFVRVTGQGAGGIDFIPEGRTVIELYPDHHWFSVRITGMRRVHTIAAATGPVIAMERPMTGPGHSLGPYDWPRVLRHEYTHTVTLGRTRNRLPHWFTEASAVFLEDAPRDEGRCTLLTRALESDGLLDFTQINTAFVRPRTPSERGLAYAQGHWMYEYIVTRFGPRAPLNLMDRYARGEREAEAFEAEFNLTRNQFFEQFKVWAREECRAWGTIPPEGVPTVVELLEEAKKDAGAQEDSAQVNEPTPELVSKWLERYPEHPDLIRLAVGYELAERQGEADESMIPMLEKLARVRPVDHMPHKQLARLYLASQTPEKAIEHLEFLDTREQYLTTYAVELARRYAATRDFQKAFAKSERAGRIAPFDPAIRELAATVAIQAKDFAAARRHLEALIAIEPDRAVHKKRLEALAKMQAGI